MKKDDGEIEKKNTPEARLVSRLALMWKRNEKEESNHNDHLAEKFSMNLLDEGTEVSRPEASSGMSHSFDTDDTFFLNNMLTQEKSSHDPSTLTLIGIGSDGTETISISPIEQVLKEADELYPIQYRQGADKSDLRSNESQDTS